MKRRVLSSTGVGWLRDYAAVRIRLLRKRRYFGSLEASCNIAQNGVRRAITQLTVSSPHSDALASSGRV